MKAATLSPSMGSATFTFSTAPRPVDPSRPKFRDTRGNILLDPRVKQANPLYSSGMKAAYSPAATSPARQKRYQRREKEGSVLEGLPAVDGRQHADVQTEPYLEELADKPKEATVDTQTDAFLDRPPSPLFVPRKTGVDEETQVLPGELFDFDLEVEPILEVIVGKTLDQALTEVAEEDELASLRERQQAHERKRLAELAEVQRLEEAELRRVQERDRRLAQEKERAEAQKQAQAQAEMRTMARSYVADLTKAVFSDLKKEGYFYDRVEREVETQFMPWLRESVDASVQQQRMSRALVDALLKHTLERAASRYSAATAS